MTEEAKETSTLCTLGGLYQFKLMPLGLTNAPATFQRLMERISAGLQWKICLIYVNDIMISSQIVDQNVDPLEVIFTCLKTAGLRLKPKKCQLFKMKVHYLRHMVGDQGIETDLEKIQIGQHFTL